MRLNRDTYFVRRILEVRGAVFRHRKQNEQPDLRSRATEVMGD